ncbi:hypothetical protein GCM10025859_26180 [Alicyclobacillus fastidiosus]|nr:hypothetical protein GCM10025859_26180 [Alicyclobacillus fastidiosus]
MFAITSWMAPLVYGLIILSDGFQFHTHRLDHLVYFIDAVIVFPISIVLLNMFRKRKKAWVNWMLFYQIYAFMLLYIDIMYHKPTTPTVFGFLEIPVIAAYLLRSKRVKRTFVY